MDPYDPPDDPDVDNPYAPPQSTFVPEPLTELTAGMPFTVGDVFNWSWAIYKEKMGLCMAIFWGAFGVNLTVSVAVTILQQGLAVIARDPTLFKIAYLVAQFISIVINVWLGIGQSRAFLKIARGQPVGFEEIFQGGRFVLTTILATIAFAFILAVPIFVAAAVIVGAMAAMGTQSIGGVIVFLVVGSVAGIAVVVATARLVMFYYMVIDRDAGVIESLQLSWQVCRDRSGTIVLVSFVQMAISIAGILAFCVGIIWAAPLGGLLFPVTYLALTGTSSARPGKPEFIGDDEI